MKMSLQDIDCPKKDQSTELIFSQESGTYRKPVSASKENPDLTIRPLTKCLQTGHPQSRTSPASLFFEVKSKR